MPSVISDAGQMTGFNPLQAAATSPSQFSFVVMADTQHGQGQAGMDPRVPQLVSDIAARNPSVTIFPGDLAGIGSASVWNDWLDMTASLGDNRFIVPGNHDWHPYWGQSRDDWQRAFSTTTNPSRGLPWVDQLAAAGQVGPTTAYDLADPRNNPANGAAFNDRRGVDYYVDFGNTRIISVATDGGTPGQETNVVPPVNLEWFQGVMQDPTTQAMDNVLVFTHRPITIDALGGDTDTGGTSGEWWQSITGQDGNGGAVADAVFTGHWHLYRPSRPDPNVDTQEIIVGTGTINQEGYDWMRHFGFVEVAVDGDRMTARFWGDGDGDGQYDEVLDRFVIDPGTGQLQQGQLTRYQFDAGNENRDTSLDVLSRRFNLALEGGAQVVNDAQRGQVLDVGGGAFAGTHNLGDHNLAILGDLTISLYAKADNASIGGSNGENVLVSYGAEGFLATIGAGDREQAAENHAYRLSIDPDGRLRLSWEYRREGDWDDTSRLQWEDTVSTVGVSGLDEWHQIQVVRDADTKTVTFFIDGQQLGDAVAFEHLPSGTSVGSLTLGSTFGGDNGFAGLIDDVQIFNNDTGTAGQLVGDMDFDGFIDLDDFNTLLAHFGDTLDISGDMSTFALGDMDFDGDVDFADFDIFATAYAITNPEAPALSVPEPGSFALLALGGLLLGRRRHRTG